MRSILNCYTSIAAHVLLLLLLRLLLTLSLLLDVIFGDRRRLFHYGCVCGRAGRCTVPRTGIWTRCHGLALGWRTTATATATIRALHLPPARLLARIAGQQDAPLGVHLLAAVLVQLLNG